MDIIVCPTCNRSVPAGFGQCQFCGGSLAGIAKPTPSKGYFAYEDGHTQTYFGKPKWVYPAYNAVCVYYILSGLYTVIASLLVKPGKSEVADIISFVKIIGMVVGGVYILFGIGLLAKVEFLRGIVNFFCGLSIIFALISLPGALAGVAVSGFSGFVNLAITIVNIVINALMIYLIGETD
jgi:hypothetical protein